MAQWSFSNLKQLAPFVGVMSAEHPCRAIETIAQYMKLSKTSLILTWQINGDMYTVSVLNDGVLFALDLMRRTWNEYRLSMRYEKLQQACECIKWIMREQVAIKKMRLCNNVSVISDEVWGRLEMVCNGMLAEETVHRVLGQFSTRGWMIDNTSETIHGVTEMVCDWYKMIAQAVKQIENSTLHVATLHLVYVQQLQDMLSATANMFHYYTATYRMGQSVIETCQHLEDAVWFIVFLQREYDVYFGEFRGIQSLPEWVKVSCGTILAYAKYIGW